MGEFSLDKFRFPMPSIPQMPAIDLSEINRALEAKRERDLVDLGFAHVLYERLVAEIADFQASLDSDQEIAAYLASFGARVIVLIDSVRFRNPYYIIFDGVNAETGEHVRLVQHTTQTSVLLAATKVQEPRKPRRIGFYVEDDEPKAAEQEEQAET